MIILYSILLNFCFTQDIYTDYLVVSGDTIDIFSYQIPENYNSNNGHPLLVTFHQWGGNENSNYSTEFDEEANNRNWVMLSPYGGSANNYNHQGSQNMVQGEIEWMMDHFNIDSKRIYMVGGSMGGASGTIYSNNHLNPKEPMVAATASASGILDCERRAIEMDGNNSMIEWFGGNWYEVPFEYHRNSAVYFADSTQSMHYNLQHLPLYLDFGTSEPHRTHAEDLYNLLTHYNENMWIDSEPTGSHGYSVFDENHVCDWLSQFELIDNPDIINVNLDEPSRAYWIEAYNIDTEDEFIRINASHNYDFNPEDTLGIHTFSINQHTNSDSLILHILDSEYYPNTNFNPFIYLTSIMNLGFSGDIFDGENLINIEIQNPIDCTIDYTINENIIWIETIDSNNNSPCTNAGEGLGIFFEFATLPDTYDDINQDGIWDVLDIVLVVGYIMDITILSEIQQLSADLNEDGNINVLDIVEILNIIF